MQNQEELIKKIIEYQENLNALVEQLKAVSPHLFQSQKSSSRFEIPTLNELKIYIEKMDYSVNAETFHAFYSSKNWMVGKNKMKCWKSALITWNLKSNREIESRKSKNNGNPANWTDNNVDFFDSMNSQDF